MNSTGIIILAAGSSSRLGDSKQLLPYKGKTLLNHTVDEAFKAGLHPVIVVTGANAEKVSATLQNEEVTTVYNKDWQQGMASGIVCGLSKILLQDKDTNQLIIAVCDQPFVSAGLFRQLTDKKAATDKGIVACVYAGTLGTPVLFSQSYFNKLVNLSGDEGAKRLVKIYNDDVATIDFPRGNIDIDTKEDYRLLLDNED